MFDEKAQLHTLEGVAAATIMLTVIIYAIDATSMTPLTSSTANEHVETELAILGQDILNTLDYAEPGDSSKLKKDFAKIDNWITKEYVWDGAKYVETVDSMNLLRNSSLADVLNVTVASRGIAHNVEITYLRTVDNVTSPYSTRFIYNGDPSNNAVILSRKIVLHNTDCAGDDGCEDDEERPINDIDPSTDLYNIIDVKLILWRT